MEIAVPEQFNNIKNDKLELKDGKIYNQINSSFLIHILMILAFIIAFSLYCWVANDAYRSYGYFPRNDPFRMWFAILFVVLILVFDKCIKIYNIIDFSKDSISREIFFFGSWLKLSSSTREDIASVGNTVIGLVTNPGGKRGRIKGRYVNLNLKTNLYNSYCVNILTKNGKVYCFELGYFEENYDDSIKFASTIADYWNIPNTVCEQDQHLVVWNLGKGSYGFSNEKISYCNDDERFMKRLLNFIIFAVSVFLITYIIYLCNPRNQKEPPIVWENYLPQKK